MALRRLLPLPSGRIALLLLGALVAALLAAFAYRAFVSPSKLRVAVGPAGSSDAHLIEAFAKSLEERRRDVHLRVVQFDNVRSSAEALERETVDLAVVRPDVYAPGNGLTVA